MRLAAVRIDDPVGHGVTGIVPVPGLTLLFGKNGTGKTVALESITSILDRDFHWTGRQGRVEDDPYAFAWLLLAGDWAGDTHRLAGDAWMNPPYGRPIGAWMAKAHQEAQKGATVVTLVPVRADTAWWHEHVLATGAEVRYVHGRLTFGDAVNTAAFASAVVIYRPTDTVGRPGPVGIMSARPSSSVLALAG